MLIARLSLRIIYPLCFALASLLSFGLAQPGSPPPLGLVLKIETAQRLRQGQLEKLVWIERATAKRVEVFTSRSGRTHVRFDFEANGEWFSAIMFAGEWTETEVSLLRSQEVSLIGLWDRYGGAHSLVTKWVTLANAYADPYETAQAVDRERDMVSIENAHTYDITKFVSRSTRMHARFKFRVAGRSDEFSGIVYEGVWNTDLLDRLRSGTANLVGYWEEYQGEPSFVLRAVEP